MRWLLRDGVRVSDCALADYVAHLLSIIDSLNSLHFIDQGSNLIVVNRLLVYTTHQFVNFSNFHVHVFKNLLKLTH